MKVLGVIPARLGSSRLPEKVLSLIAGKSVLQRVYEQAKQAQVLSEIIIAADDQKIVDHAKDFGAFAILTSKTHESGTDRVAEAVAHLQSDGKDFDIIANIQGDMPFLNPHLIDHLVHQFSKSFADFDIATPAVLIRDRAEWERPQIVKVIFQKSGRALYFSRAAIPYIRDPRASPEAFGYRHIGIYLYSSKALFAFTALPPSALEKIEKLEQLRAIWHGQRILISEIPENLVAGQIDIDTQEDLDRARDLVVGGQLYN